MRSGFCPDHAAEQPRYFITKQQDFELGAIKPSEAAMTDTTMVE